MRKVFLLLFSLLAFYACNLNSLKLTVINDTENIIYYQLVPDTIPRPNEGFYTLYPHETIMPAFIRQYGLMPWVDQINKHSVDSALHIFIFPTDQITDEMIKNREYVQLSYKVKELDSLNWTVVYRGCSIFQNLSK